MKISEKDMEYVARVMRLVSSSPTAASMDELLSAHARLGYISASANQIAEYAESERKYQESVAAVRFKQQDPKASATTIDNLTKQATWDFMQEEISARGRAKKISNLLSSVQECINGIKFLGRTM